MLFPFILQPVGWLAGKKKQGKEENLHIRASFFPPATHAHTDTHTHDWRQVLLIYVFFFFGLASLAPLFLLFSPALYRLPLLFSLECVLDKLTGGETRQNVWGGGGC